MVPVILLAAALFLLAACGTNPTGPVVNNSGDSNCFNIHGGDESDNNDCTTPAPVVVTPVVVTPPAEPEA